MVPYNIYGHEIFFPVSKHLERISTAAFLKE